MSKEFKSIFKKVKSISNGGLKHYEEGKRNFENQTTEIEALAKERLDNCKNCCNFVPEPNELFHVGNVFGLEKNDYLETNNKMCDNCGCLSTLLIRQSQKICKNWKK